MQQKKTFPAAGFSAISLALALGIVGTARGGNAPSEWATGQAFRERLELPVSVYWSGEPFRAAVTRLGRAQRVAVLIDRRVDPDQPIEFSIQNAPLEQAFRQIAARRQLGCSLFGSLVYFGPPQAASQLRTVAEMARDQVRKLPLARSKKFAQPAALRWNDFATPREILSRIAEPAGLTIDGADRLPHDLWAEADLPPMPLADRLTLVAFQFDLTFQVPPDGNAIRLVPLPQKIAVARDYPGGSDARLLAERWRQLVPESRIEIVGARIHVEGRLEDLERIADTLRPSAPRTAPRREAPPDLRRTGFTLAVSQAPLGPLLERLASQLKAQAQVELTIDREGLQRAGISLDQRVSFDVQNVSLDGLLRAVLRGTGCTFRCRGNAVEIRPE